MTLALWRTVALCTPVALVAALAGCAVVRPAAPPVAPTAAVWITTGDKTQLLARNADVPIRRDGVTDAADAAGALQINVDATQRHQRMAGFGASMTDASAWLIQHRMSPAQREALLRELFGRADSGAGQAGAGFDLTRLTIGASDFSRHHYSLNDLPPGVSSDPELKHFSLAPNRDDVLPVMRQALAINPALQVMASPWSAPAWMKTTGSLIKGTLRDDAYGPFARYLLKYVDAMHAEGVPVFALTVQNEPHFEPDDYPGMRLEPPQRIRLLADHLGPLLKARSEARIVTPQIIDWDHNWDEPQSPRAVLSDPAARAVVSGIGWHCYAGDVAVQAQLQAEFPDKDGWFTECSGGAWKPHWPETLPWLARHLVVGAVRGGARGVLMWNLALDENHGPHRGGCKDCRGVVTIDSRTGAVTRNMEYYVLAHASRFVRPGAQRIDSTDAAGAVDAASGPALRSVAFRNADDGSRVLVIVNSSAQAQAVAVRDEAGRRFTQAVPPASLVTLTWAGE